MENNHLINELMQSWIVAKHLNVSKFNDYLSNSLITYNEYSSFMQDLEYNLNCEKSLKDKGYPVEKKRRYLNSEKCLNGSKKAKDCLEKYLQNYEKNNELFHKLFVKIDQIYEKLKLASLNISDYLGKIRGNELAKIVLNSFKNEFNPISSINKDLTKKYEIIQSCLNNYNILKVMNDKQKVEKMKEEIEKIYFDCYTKVHKEGFFKKISNLLKNQEIK
ncbi:MAG: hypothetical protein WC376_00540 [Candidatus Nanoarchaeia archaeon]|jgi:formyltetrahydrofolate synthetase